MGFNSGFKGLIYLIIVGGIYTNTRMFNYYCWKEIHTRRFNPWEAPGQDTLTHLKHNINPDQNRYNFYSSTWYISI